MDSQLESGMKICDCGMRKGIINTCCCDEIPDDSSSMLSGLLVCPMCNGVMKDQVYIDEGIEHGHFYCLSSECFMPPVTFRNRVEYKMIKRTLAGAN